MIFGPELNIRLCSHHTGYLFVAPRKAMQYSMNTYPIHDSVSTLEIRAEQLRPVTEITPPQPFLCLNRSPIRYGFRAGAKAIRYSLNIG